MKRTAFIVSGIALILLGFVFIPLPIPAGALLVLAGTALLISSSRTFASFIRFLRGRIPILDGVFARIALILPAPLTRALNQTDPQA